MSWATASDCPSPSSIASSRAPACRRGRHEATDDVEAVLAGEQRARRLVAGDLGRQRRAFALRDVRGVGEHGVDLPHAGEQIALEERDRPVEPEPHGVGARDVQRVGARSVAQHLEVRPLLCERERDGAAAGPDVDDPGTLHAPLHPDLDEQLGLRPRHEHAPVHLELEMAKAAPPGDVGDGLAAGRAPPHRVLKGAHRRPLHLARRDP